MRGFPSLKKHLVHVVSLKPEEILLDDGVKMI
jgi:hypothetical protein